MPTQTQRKLFLDDIRAPYNDSWHVARSYSDLVRYIETHGVPDIISFDHDLAFEHYPFSEANPSVNRIPYETYQEKTGYHAAIWLAEHGHIDKLKEAWVHTQNNVGRTNIMAVLRKYKVPRRLVTWNNGVAYLYPATNR